MKNVNYQSASAHFGRVLNIIVICLSTLLLAGGASYGTYQWQHNMVLSLEQEKAQLNLELSDLKKQLSGVDTTDQVVYTSKKGVKVKIYTPTQDAKIKNPVIIFGEVPGDWSFEASFPVLLKDSLGKIVTQASARLLGDWMTTEPVPFFLQLNYGEVGNGSGTLVLEKDNPSGLLSNDDTVTIPIKFE